MTLSTRLTVAMVALVLFTATAVGVFAYRTMESALVPSALQRMETHARLIASELQNEIRTPRSDILAFRSAAALSGIVRARLNGGIHPLDGTSERVWRERMAKRFVAELASKRSYLQFRIIGVADGGREIVRVDRSGANGEIRVVPEDELQRKGDRDYFEKAIALPYGEVYSSEVSFNRERGAIEVPHVPVVRIATVIHTDAGEAFGILIINVDLRPALARLRAGASHRANVYLVNDRGDYLLHPDARREFGFEFGRAVRIQDEFPSLAGAGASDTAFARLVQTRAGARIGAAVAPIAEPNGHRLAVIETLPYAAMLAPAAGIRNAGLAAALAAALAAVAVAVVISRSLARPIGQVARAAEAFSHDQPMVLPVDDGGEIGLLARAFSRMAGEIRHKTAALKREIEERRRIFTNSADLILVVDRRGNFIQVSPSCEAILGYRPEEMIGRNAVDFVYPEDLDGTRQQMRLARIGRGKRNFDTRYVHRDGRIVTLTWTGVWSEPEQQHFFIGRDMTEQRLVEDKFRLAVEANPNGLIIVDQAGTIVMSNQEMERLFGFTQDELIGQSVERLIPVRLRDQHAQHRADYALDPARRHRVARNRRLTGLHKNGTEFPVEVDLNPIRTEEGLFTLSVIVDITERERMLHSLQNSLARQEAMFVHAPIGIITLNASASIETLNPAAEAMFGVRAGAIMRRDLNQLIDLGGSPHLSSARRLDELLAGARFIHECIGRRGDGVEFPVDCAVAEMTIGGRRMFVLFVRDISLRREHERMKDEFVATVSHELRTPLTSIAGSLGLLAANAAGQLPPAAQRMVELARSNSQRLVRLINDILDIQRIEAGKIAFDLKPVEVRALVQQAIEAHRGFAESYGVRVKLDSAADDCLVRADPDRLTQVVTNLLSNAVKFSPSGGEVNVSVRASNRAVHIEVRDRGAGIPDEFKPRIFDKFAQADASNARQKGGTGLGLSIVKQIVIRLGGEVGFDAAPGGGTIFRVELPRTSSPDLPTSPLPAPIPRILLCEDDPEVADVLRANLKMAGFETDVSRSAGEAVRNAAETTYAAILIDLQLPDADGITLIKRLRAQPPYRSAPIIVVSADPQRGRDDERSSSLNVLDWLSKPVDIDRLVGVVNRAIAGEQARRRRILHVDDDRDMLQLVARAVSSRADIVSVDSVAAARAMLATGRFDLVVLDIALADGSGLDLLSNLYDEDGNPIPVIVFSAQDTPKIAAHVLATVTKSRASIDDLIATLHRLVDGKFLHPAPAREVA